ncbi:hypothetical protein FGIG_04333 [Fasciola gigantica]|uniref:Uncharacterized protein n=1 Tax=Fasciola gigantica TaxID=46835 RepID=A0A504YM10_FASGI|nr:hypothetical protein FGIG_04333 [Fasciola gigantica]
MLALMLTVFAVIKSHLLDGTEAVWNSKCQLLQYAPFQSRRLWWTYDGRRLPPLTFQMRNVFGSSHIHSQFDLAAAGEGWNQMFVSPDGHSLWIQQLCIRRFGEGFSDPTSDNSLESFTQPLFYGIRASTTSWCHAIYSSHTLGTEPRNVGSVTAYPIHYEVQCVKQQVDKHLWLLVRLKLDRHKWVYQCVQIRTHTGGSLIQLRQSQSYTFEPKDSLCSDLNTYESIIWIPSLQKYYSPTGVTCPLNGGFQITSIKELGKEKVYADVPDKLEEHAKSYEGSKPVWIGLGLRFPARVIDSMTSNNLKFPTPHDHIQTILTRDHALTTLWNDRTSVYEIHIRRASQSQRQGTYVESLCDFRSAANPTKTVQPKTWIKQPINFDKRQNDSPKGMKCGLYQILLTGTMIINTALLHVIEQTHIGYRSPHSTFPVVRTSSWTGWSDDLFDRDFDANLSLRSKHATGRGKRTATSSFPKVPRICSLQLSDFNRSFGATGEFDNTLRVETACSNSLATRMLNTTHECISVYNLEQVPHKTSKLKMIITHTPSRDEYYCWIFEDTSKGLEKTYIVHVFNSPQCRYTQTPAGAIIVDEEQALIRMDLTPGLCLSCHRTWNDQQSVTKPLTQPPRASKTSHATDQLLYRQKTKVTRKMDISKQQPRMRSLRVSAQSRITTAVGHRSIRRGVWLTTISVLMSSIWFLSVVP